MKHIKIMKFGGASLANGERILRVAKIVKKMNKKASLVIVVSAMSNVTDALISVFSKYKEGDISSAFDEMKYLYEIHSNALLYFKLGKKENDLANLVLRNLFGNLSLYLTLHREYSIANYDYVVSFGERFSACLVSFALIEKNANAVAIDGSSVIIANHKFNNAKALLEDTRKAAVKKLLPLLKRDFIPVVTGFFAANKKGSVVTLGRGGSDYSATVLANALDAKEVILWKEVNGVFSCDPKNNSQAIFYPKLSYEKASELAKNGAKILHPEAMKPVSSKKIVVWVKNTFNPKFAGTKIYSMEENI